jgi:hypothetical protein
MGSDVCATKTTSANPRMRGVRAGFRVASRLPGVGSGSVAAALVEIKSDAKINKLRAISSCVPTSGHNLLRVINQVDAQPSWHLALRTAPPDVRTEQRQRRCSYTVYTGVARAAATRVAGGGWFQ